jgi:hypothetical protein
MRREDGDSMEPVQIGVRQIYDLIIALDGKMDTYIHAQEPRIALLDHRLTTVEQELAKSSDRQWQLWLALIASLTALLCAALPLVIK